MKTGCFVVTGAKSLFRVANKKERRKVFKAFNQVWLF